jgi:hypothetical protein
VRTAGTRDDRAREIERERPAAVDGSHYGVMAPLYIGRGGFYSYLRLFNGNVTTSASFTVKVVGSPTGRDYGTAIYAVPARAGRQLSVSTILTDAGAAIQAPDTGFSFYLQTSQRSAGYQHVTHSPAESYFENSTVCRSLLQQAISGEANRIFVWGAHTSDPIVAGYPSALDLHNAANVPVTYRLSLIEETSGTIVGQTNYQTLANTSYSLPISEIERLVNWTPAPGQLRANIMIEKLDGSVPRAAAGQTIIESCFENSTVCESLLQEAIGSQANRVFVWGAHTSDPVVAAYPSALDLHNYASVAVTYRLSLIDERSGFVVGQMDYATQANASYSIPISQIERAMNWTPSSSQLRANIMIETTDGSAPQVLAGQTIINNALRVTLNMTTACAAPLTP